MASSTAIVGPGYSAKYLCQINLCCEWSTADWLICALHAPMITGKNDNNLSSLKVYKWYETELKVYCSGFVQICRAKLYVIRLRQRPHLVQVPCEYPVQPFQSSRRRFNTTVFVRVRTIQTTFVRFEHITRYKFLILTLKVR